MQSLYERLGGEAAIDAAVDQFYERVSGDPRLNHFFENADMTQLRAHQKRFLTYAFGGAEPYRGQSLRAAHEKLVHDKGLNATHFNAVIEHLGATLKHLGVSASLIAEAAAIAESTRNDILGRTH